MDKLIVIAKNPQQCRFYSDAYAYNEVNSIFISRPEQLIGMRIKKEQIIRVGEWYDNKYIDEIEARLEGRVIN